MKNALTKSTGPAGSLSGLGRLDAMFQEMNQYMNSFFNNSYWDVKVFEELQPKAALPKLNVSETDDKYEVEIAVAGYNKDDVEIELRDNCFFIKCEHNEASTDEGKNYLLKEISSRSFSRVVRFPKKIEPDTVSCTFKDGIVSCTIDKKSIVNKEENGIKVTIK